MKRFAYTTSVLLVLSMICLLSSVAATKDKPAQGRLEGFVRMINQDASTISLNVSHDTAGMWRTVVYNKGTVFTLRNKPATVDKVQAGARLIVVGQFDSDVRLVAERIEIRAEK